MIRNAATKRLVSPFAIAGMFMASGAAAADTAEFDRSSLPIDPAPFAGTVGPTVAESTPDFPVHVKAPTDAPNVVLVMTDDVGFAAASPFGGPVPTPNLQRLMERGVVYNRFHTAAMCSPTRAALLTGRNPHKVGTGSIGELTMGYPGYWGEIPRSAAPIAKVLKYNGYNTAMFGKEHNVPHSQSSPAGPFEMWPNGKGFEYFYGFIGGAMNQFAPKLIRNGAPVNLMDRPDDYILDRDLVDEAIGWIHTQQAADEDKPFFVYIAPGTAHSPHQAPAEWIARFEGAFDQGWDKLREESFERQKALGIIPGNAELTPRPDVVPAWDSLSEDEQKVQARYMEVFCAMLAYQDYQFGRLLDELDRMGVSDDTLIMFIQGDNGGTPEGGLHGEINEGGVMANGLPEPLEEKLARLDEYGGPNSMGKYSVGWGWATNTPFQWTKQVASHLGGTRNPLVVSWPGHVPEGGQVRSQYAFVADIYPTILEAANIPAPAKVEGADQQTVDGISLVYSFANADAPSQRREQAFELFGNRSVYKDGWLANTTPGRTPWYYGPTEGSPFDYNWELYYLPDDFSQARDLADSNPDKLEQMRQEWDRLARTGNLYPVSDDFSDRNFADPSNVSTAAQTRTYWGAGISIPFNDAPPMHSRSFSIEAELQDGGEGIEGVVLALGSKFGGWSFYVDDGRPVAFQSFSEIPENQFRVTGDPLPAGDVTLRYEFTYDGGGRNKGGTMRIFVNGEPAGEGRIEKTIRLPAGFSETFDTGRDTGEQVSPDYVDGGVLQGDLSKLTVHLEPLD